MKYRVSIVVPVYNVEQYLSECIDSLIAQKYDNKEIILVNDGSTDNSPAICDEYTKRYDYIKVIHKANGGLSDARNKGVASATGDYILFVDSDDYIEKDSLSHIMQVVGESPVDVVFLEAQKVFADGEKKVLGDGITKEGVHGKRKEEVLEFISNCPKYPASACTKLINHGFFVKKELWFEKGLLSEDLDWCMKLLLSAASYDYCETMYYNYRQNRVGSITSCVSEKHFSDIIYLLKKWTRFSKSAKDIEKRLVLSEMAYEYTIAIANYGSLKKEVRKHFKNEMKSLQWLLDYRAGVKYFVIKFICKCFGIEIAGFMLSSYLKVR